MSMDGAIMMLSSSIRSGGSSALDWRPVGSYWFTLRNGAGLSTVTLGGDTGRFRNNSCSFSIAVFLSDVLWLYSGACFLE